MIERALVPLNSTNSYSIASLFLREPIQKPGWFWVIKSLAAVRLLIGLVGIVIYQAWLLFLPLLAINYLIHYWSKNNLYAYAGSIPQLTRMNQAAKVIHQHQRLKEIMPEVGQAIKAIDQLGPQTSFFKLEAKLQITVQDAYHPLIDQAVANSIYLAGHRPC